MKRSVSICLTALFLAMAGVSVCTAQTPAPAAGLTAMVPLKKSARWYYERALVLFTQEKTGHAVVELYRAEEGQRVAYEVVEAKFQHKDLTPAEKAESDSIKEQLKEQDRMIAFLLGIIQRRNQRTVDAIQMFEKVLEPGAPEHILARLEMARAYADLRGWDKAWGQVQKLVKLLNVRDSRTNGGMRQIQTWLPRYKEQGAEKNLAEGFKIVLAGIETVLFDSGAKYREWTLGLKVRDPYVYNEVIRLFQEDENPEETRLMLTEAIRVREGFAPIPLLGLGDFQEKVAAAAEKEKKYDLARTEYTAAITSYEAASAQLKALDFAEGKDFSTDRIGQLRRKLETLPKAGTPFEKRTED
ncbi:MAG: hypothetical protein K1Y36_07965 [Blastocatellia bacterium]|nr:hypothetical protein [Blastocatellia bacterium]